MNHHVVCKSCLRRVPIEQMGQVEYEMIEGKCEVCGTRYSQRQLIRALNHNVLPQINFYVVTQKDFSNIYMFSTNPN